MAPSPRTLPEGIEDTILAEIIGCLSSDESFSKNEPFGNNAPIFVEFFAQYIPRQSLSQLLPSYLASIRAQFVILAKFQGPKKVLRMPGCPIVLATEEVGKIVNVILNAKITRRPLSFPKV
jgi:hypothetical protein